MSLHYKRWGSSVSIVNMLWAVFQFPVGAGIFSLFTTSRQALVHTQPPIQWVLGSHFPWVKWSGHQADHSPPSSAKVKNA